MQILIHFKQCLPHNLSRKVSKHLSLIGQEYENYYAEVDKEITLPEGNTVPVKEQNCTINFRAETAIGQSSQ